MERKDLLTAIETVAPALSTNDLIQVLTHFWFDGKTVMAYNDQISLRVPLETTFKGAVPGSILLALMKASRAAKVEFTADKDVLGAKIGRSNLKLGLLPTELFAFEIPDPAGPDAVLDVKHADLMDQVELCLASVGTDVAVPDQLGITFLIDDGELLMFSTNGATMTRAELAYKGSVPFKDRVILSTQFCNQLLRLGRANKKGGTLEIHKDYALYIIGETYLFGRLIESQHPLKYVGTFDNHFPDAARKKVIEIPKGFPGMLERAVIVTDTSLDQPYSTITVKGGNMEFYSKTEHGEVRDEIEVGKHPNAALKIKPKLLKAAEPDFDNLLMTDTCAIFERKGAVFLVAAQQA